MKLFCVGAVITVFSVAALATSNPEPKSGNSRLLGKWTWTRSTNSCVETYEYRTDGTLYVVSGAEKSDNTFNLSYEPTANGFYRLATMIVKDYGGKDCGDSEEDDTGATDINFVRFHPSGNQYIICRDETLNQCFGPLRRMSQ